MIRSLRIAVITQGRSAVVEPLLASRHRVVALVESAPRSPAPPPPAMPIWRKALRAAHRRIRPWPSLERLAATAGIAYLRKERGADDALVDLLCRVAPDLLVVFSMSELLRERVFSLPPLGAINLHPSALPKYRGPNPWFWHYRDFDLEPGVTVHAVDRGEDTGDIFAQVSRRIAPGTRRAELSDLLIRQTGVPLLLDAIDRLAAGAVERRAQPESSPTVRARNPRPDERFIDWEAWPAERVWHFLRGTSGSFDAIAAEFTSAVAGSEALDIERRVLGGLPPGTLQRLQGGAVIACRDGLIRIREPRGARALRPRLGADHP